MMLTLMLLMLTVKNFTINYLTHFFIFNQQIQSSPHSHPLYKHNLYIFTLVLGLVFYIVKCPLYCHKLIIVTIKVIHGPNIIITYENFPIYSHISLLRKYIMSFESKILSFAVVSQSAPILIWK